MSSQSSTIDPAVFSITTTANTAYTSGMVTIRSAGSGYKQGDSMNIHGNLLGGTSPANDMRITVTGAVTASGGVATVSVTGTSSATATTRVVTMDMAFGPNFLRDASDRTRAIRERLIYNEKRVGTNIIPGTPGLVIGRPQNNPAGVNHLPAGNTEILWQQQGNDFRLAYLAGKMKCGAAFGGVYNLNGPNSFNASGAQSGS